MPLSLSPDLEQAWEEIGVQREEPTIGSIPPGQLARMGWQDLSRKRPSISLLSHGTSSV